MPQSMSTVHAILFFTIFYFLNKFIYFYLFIGFGCIGSSWLRARFSLVVASRAYSSLWCAGFSLQWLLLLQSTGSRVQASVVVAHRLSSCGSWALLLHGMWDLPGPGLKPISPALAGKFLTTVPPGKPSILLLMGIWVVSSVGLFVYPGPPCLPTHVTSPHPPIFPRDRAWPICQATVIIGQS